ncbi:MAG: DUF1272 domain-containing protein [Chloroflexota bacterium]
MPLIMKESCERCAISLPAHGVAYICIHECTFCAPCSDTMKHVCPNCGGELVPRPRRNTPSSTS